ncbi:MAG: YgfZ/GcvT domain-containing protein [Pseudomonadota bacterium]
MPATAVRLPARGVLRLTGPDMRAFLQGLVTNDVARADDAHAIYAALLTAQGKYLFDFFLVGEDEDLLLEGEGARLGDLVQRLKLYKLRAKVDIADLSGTHQVWAVLGDEAAAALALNSAPGAARGYEGGVAFIDPRLAAMGARLILPGDTTPAFAEAGEGAYERLRLCLGLPDGGRDIDVERSLILEANIEPLNGVDFTKGCYVGQELTARMKHRGKVRKRLVPVAIGGEAPPPGAPILSHGREVGVMKSAYEKRGLALLRLDDLDKAPFSCAGATLMPDIPDWLAPFL